MEERYWILLNKHAANTLSLMERKELQAWTNKEPERIGLANDLKMILSSRMPEPNIDLDDAWLKMQQRIQPVRRSMWVKNLVAGVIVLLLIAAAFAGYKLMNIP